MSVADSRAAGSSAGRAMSCRTALEAHAEAEAAEGAEAAAEAEAEAAEAARIIKKAVLLMDGEYNQVKATLAEEGIGQQCQQEDIGLWKIAAACSSTQQPNDVMMAFAILKSFFKNHNFRNADPSKGKKPPYWNQLQGLMESIDPASKRTFEDCPALSVATPLHA
jgi:hypothetical protein